MQDHPNQDKHASFFNRSPTRLKHLFCSATSSSNDNDEKRAVHPLMVNLFCSILSKSLSLSYRSFHSVNILFEGKSKIVDELSVAIEELFLEDFNNVKTTKIDEGAFGFNSSMIATEDLNLLIRFRKDESFKPNITHLDFPNFKEVVIIAEAPVFYYPLFRMVSVSETLSFAEFCVLFCELMLADESQIASNNIIGVPLLWFYNLHFIKELGVLEHKWEKLPMKMVSKLYKVLGQTVDDFTFHFYNELPDMKESLGQRIQLVLDEEKFL
ncbi:hypothetical protein FRX31_026852 [Thalictrum thalictroides]|uniref:Uncharacterized protein n=1 Tax=Thalictrum thalictroides TaxID=46969 RepID=A0A7J6VFV9_THATH|nr:hypothetical protein FRX31_026852 [Thalictrum thalictroides]